MSALIKKIFKPKSKDSDPQDSPATTSSDNKHRNSDPLQILNRRTRSDEKIKILPAAGDGPYNRDPRMRNQKNRILAQSSNRRPDVDHANPPPAPRRAPVWTDRLRDHESFKDRGDDDEEYGGGGGRQRGGYGGGRDVAGESSKEDDRVYEFTDVLLGDFQREQEENKARGKATFATVYHRREARKKKFTMTKKELAQWQRDQEALKQGGHESHATKIFGRAAGHDQMEEEEDELEDDKTREKEPQQDRELAHEGTLKDGDAGEPNGAEKPREDQKEKRGKKKKKEKNIDKVKEADVESGGEPQPHSNGTPSIGDRVTAIRFGAGVARTVSSASQQDRGLSLEGEESEQAPKSAPAIPKPVPQQPRSSSASVLPVLWKQGSWVDQRQSSPRSKQLDLENDEEKLEDMVSRSQVRSSWKRATGKGKSTPSSKPTQDDPDNEDEDVAVTTRKRPEAKSELKSTSQRVQTAVKNQGSELARARTEKSDAMLAKSLQEEENQSRASIQSDMEAAVKVQEAERENLSRRKVAFESPERVNSMPITGTSKPLPQLPSGFGRRRSSAASAAGSQSFSNSRIESSSQAHEDVTSRVPSGHGRRKGSVTLAGAPQTSSSPRPKSSAQAQDDLESTSWVLSNNGRRASTNATIESAKGRGSKAETQSSSTRVSTSSHVPTLMNRGFADGRRTYLEAVRPIADLEEDDGEYIDAGDGNSSESGDSGDSVVKSILHRGFGDGRRSVLEAVRPIAECDEAVSGRDDAGHRRKTVGGAGRR